MLWLNSAEVVAQLELNKSSVDKIQTVPYAELLAAGNAALRKLQPSPPVGGIGMPAVRSTVERLGFSPVVDGKIVTRHPFDPDAPNISANVPMIIGTVLNETSPSMTRAALESMTENDVRKRAAERYGARAGMVVDAYRKAYPDVKPVELLSRMFSVRTNAVTQAERKAALKAAPAYVYLFAWQTPILDGRPRAFHCSEIPLFLRTRMFRRLRLAARPKQRSSEIRSATPGSTSPETGTRIIAVCRSGPFNLPILVR